MQRLFKILTLGSLALFTCMAATITELPPEPPAGVTTEEPPPPPPDPGPGTVGGGGLGETSASIAPNPTPVFAPLSPPVLITETPEPSSFALIGFGMVALSFYRKK